MIMKMYGQFIPKWGTMAISFVVYILTVAFLSLVTVQGYRRGAEDEYEDEYYSQEEYEEEGSGYVEEEEPPEGQQEFLQIRERLKEEIRQRALAGASTAGRSSSSHDRRPPPPAK
jgi:protein SPT2